MINILDWHVYPLAIPICGSIGVHGYGIMIFIGVLLFLWRLYARLTKLSLQISFNTLYSLLVSGLIVGVIGGRVLYILSEPENLSLIDMLCVWSGGFSILGTVLALIITLPLLLKHYKISMFPFLDLVAVYAPLAHMFGRFGCLWAGCCFGSAHVWGPSVTYSGCTAGALTGVALIPVQLYSALLFLSLFIILRLLSKSHVILKKSGLLFSAYIIGVGLERFTTDFLRGDRVVFYKFLDINQIIALGLVALGLCFVSFILFKKSKKF